MSAARHRNREYGTGRDRSGLAVLTPPLDLTGIGKRKMRSPLLEHLKDLQDFSEMLLRQLFEKLFHRTTACFILVKLHRPGHFLNDISVNMELSREGVCRSAGCLGSTIKLSPRPLRERGRG